MGAVPTRQLREELEGKLRPVADKLAPVEAAMRLVGDGDHLAIGGTLYSRTPMALLFELLRQGRAGLTLSRPLTCYEAELFLVAGAARGIVTSWVGIGLPWGISRVVRELVEDGRATYEEWSHLALGLRYKAGAMGVPFLPTFSMLGSDLVRLVDTHELTCPFTGEKVLLVPALNPDVALVHVQRADRFGNAQIDGYTHMDADMAAAARTVIVSTEDVVPPERIRERPDATIIPHFLVDAVVEAPMGAFPHECYGRYEADFAHFDEYTAVSWTPQELMTVSASRLLRDHRVVFAGVGVPLLASVLAKRRQAPDLTIVLEGGIIGPSMLEGKLPISTNEMRAARHAAMLTAIADVFLLAQRGFLHYGFLGAAQIDMYGNINTSVIGPVERPRVRLPGTGGANDIASLCNEVLVVTAHESRRFVERVDFVTSPGHLGGGDAREKAGLISRGPSTVVTDLAQLDFEPQSKRMRLRALQPGVGVADVRAQTGFELLVHPEVGELRPPDAEELRILRELESGAAGGD